MASPTAEEQYLLELINNARLDPYGSLSKYVYSISPLISLDSAIDGAFKYYNIDGRVLTDQIAQIKAVGPVAWNDQLASAAEAHSAAQIAADTQSHQVTGEPALGDRLAAAGYTRAIAAGENVYAYAKSVLYAHAGFFVDWGDGATGMQSPAGHRLNIMSGSFTEVGLDVTAEANAATGVGPYVVTEDFGSRGKYFVTGVAYADKDKNAFYSIGEGVSGLNVVIGNASTASAAAGGYTLGVTTLGNQVIKLSGAGLVGTVTVNASIIDENLKLDVVNGDTLLTSGSISVSGFVGTVKALGVKSVAITTGDGAQEIRGDAGSDTLDGGAGDDVIYGGKGDDTLFGGAGNDLLVGELGNDTIDGGDGIDTAVFGATFASANIVANRDGSITIVTGKTGIDTVRNVEFFRFSDGQYKWNASSKVMEQLVNNAPTIAAGQHITTTRDIVKQFTILASDPDGDKLTFTSSAALNGVITGGADGVFTYTPNKFFTGPDSIRVTVSDGRGGTYSQSINIDVYEPTKTNTAPTVTATQAVSTKQDVAKQFTVSGSDADGDNLTYSAGTAQHGAISGGANGVFTYTPTKGYSGTDSFTVTVDDGKGGKATQTVSVDVSFVAPPASSVGTSPSPFRLFAPDGAVETIGGVGSIGGTNGFQDITLLKYKGEVTFDASYNRGGDIIRLPGNASDYKAVMVNLSTAKFIVGDSSYVIPVGSAGTTIVFGDGVRLLQYDTTARIAKIGGQSITSDPLQITAPSDNSPLPTGPAQNADARVFLGAGADVTVGGKNSLTGTNGAEKVHYVSGDLKLDASFNKGGDILYLPDPVSSFEAYIVGGSSLVLTSAKGDISIPVGTAGMVLDFLGDLRVLRYDPTLGKIVVGDQAITATTENGAEQLGVSGISLDVGSLSTAVTIDLATGANHTLVDKAGELSNVVIRGFDQGDVIRVSGANSSDYSFAKVDDNGDGIYSDLEISYSDSAVNRIIILNAVSPNAYVGDLATAKAAFGSNFILFGSETSDSNPSPGVPAGSVSLDVGTPATPKQIVLDAGSNTSLSDDATALTHVNVQGFNVGDMIHVLNASLADYNFANADVNGDGVFGDLSITSSIDGVNNIINLLGAIGTNAPVFDLASAQAAIGGSFMTLG